jgi:hypothetical protein
VACREPDTQIATILCQTFGLSELSDWPEAVYPSTPSRDSNPPASDYEATCKVRLPTAEQAGAGAGARPSEIFA